MKLSRAVLASAALFLSACSDAPNESLTVSKLQPASPPPSMDVKPDFREFQLVDEKKKAFVSFMKPGVDYINELLVSAHNRLIALEKSGSMNEDDKQFLSRVSELFNHPLPENGPDKAWYKEALKRVDVIPADLVLTQAAKESGWGTSRFAREGNNYFGQWCYTAGCGLVPGARTEGMTHEVAVFDDAYQSIRAYFLNVNRNRAYAGLRDIRSQLRKSNQPLSGEALANGLISYSERGQAYVDEVQGMIRYNENYWSQG